MLINVLLYHFSYKLKVNKLFINIKIMSNNQTKKIGKDPHEILNVLPKITSKLSLVVVGESDCQELLKDNELILIYRPTNQSK